MTFRQDLISSAFARWSWDFDPKSADICYGKRISELAEIHGMDNVVDDVIDLLMMTETFVDDFYPDLYPDLDDSEKESEPSDAEFVGIEFAMDVSDDDDFFN